MLFYNFRGKSLSKIQEVVLYGQRVNAYSFFFFKIMIFLSIRFYNIALLHQYVTMTVSAQPC